jgi:hypothetical protein
MACTVSLVKVLMTDKKPDKMICLAGQYVACGIQKNILTLYNHDVYPTYTISNPVINALKRQ